MQVTTPWVARYNIQAADFLDSCTNIRVGTGILLSNYRACMRVGRDAKVTLECALSAYWSGDDTVGGAYVNQVYRLAGSEFRVRATPSVSDGVLLSEAAKPASVPGELAGFSPRSSAGFTFK